MLSARSVKFEYCLNSTKYKRDSAENKAPGIFNAKLT